MDEPRNRNSIKYPCPILIWIGVLLFLVKLGSRRQINFQFNSRKFKDNLSLLTRQEIDKVSHDGTLAYLLNKLNPGEINRLIIKMLKRLIRMRCLEKYRLLGYYLVGIDGNGHLTFKQRHCRHCLTKEKDGKILYYYHNILEAEVKRTFGSIRNIARLLLESLRTSVFNETELQAVQLSCFQIRLLSPP